MKFKDLFAMSLSNLWRRKLRTLLTVLGVVIGTASIVVMLSLGFGLKESLMSEVSSSGSLTEISISQGYGLNGADNKDTMLTEKNISKFEELEHVEEVAPKLEVSCRLHQGKYAAWVILCGVPYDTLKEIPLGSGECPKEGDSKLNIIYGNMVITDFYNPNTGEYPYWDVGELADVDLMNKNVFFEFNQDGTTDSAGNYVEGKTIKKILPVAGIVAGDVDDYSKYSYYAYADIESLEKFLEKQFKDGVIPGQPSDKNGNPYKFYVYSEITVLVDEVENVDEVMENIQDMGFQASSNKEWIEQTENEFKIIQMVLGGIGAVSLFVAAIGIANTMMMSTYERTKEIGIIKVLGCDLNNIRLLFLSEAACIGFLGGILGLVLSYTMSIIINIIVKNFGDLGDMNISIIPIWLAVVAVIFAAFVGMVAGFFPAQRATKLSPLAAIRNE